MRFLPFVGIDDFAFKKRFTYGTILVDLKTNQPIDLLPTRVGKDVTAWIKQYPNIEIISRDGSKTYAKAISKASPRIKQIGDRWHILHQLFEATKKEVYSILPARWNTQPIVEKKDVSKRKTTLEREMNEEKRWQRIQYVQTLFKKGRSIASIARELRISRGTVYSDLKITSKPSHQKSSPYDPFRPLIKQLVLKRLPAKQIEIICRSKGYNGSLSTLNRIIAEVRKENDMNTTTLSIRGKVINIIWNFHSENHLEQIKAIHPRIIDEFPELLEIDQFVHSFRLLFRRKERDGLRKWITKYKNTSFRHIRSFINGIRQDIHAIWNSIMYPWSNGPVEGQINRLKTLKRLMYGRASFQLLRNRFLYQWDKN